MIMKVMVIGLGSMGKRRIRLLKKLGKDMLIIGVDSKGDRREETKKLFEIETYSDIEEVVEKGVECAFVCTEPLSHGEIIWKCLQDGKHVFTEINLVSDRYDENIRLAKEKKRVLFLSSTFLYRDEIKYIEEEVKKSRSLLTYSYHIGQYLPDWHPWEKYTDFFIGDIRTNGCREIMAIELPWICKVFGDIMDVHVRKNKKTSLNIEYNDSYLLSIEHENGIQGMMLVDVVSRKAIRNLELFGEDLYLTWDGTANGVKKYDLTNQKLDNINLYTEIDRQEDYAEFIVENAYMSEIKTFFNEISTGKKPEYGFEEDRKILAVIDKIEGR